MRSRKRAAPDGRKRDRMGRGRSSAVALAFGLAFGCGPEPAPAPPTEDVAAAAVAAAPRAERRGLWVLCEGSQRVLEHRERLDALLADAEALGVTDLFVQVYRGGRAWFDSELADATPYAKVWRTERGDALRVLIERAHERGLAVHAWVNVLSLAGHRDALVLSTLGRGAVLTDQHGRSLLDYPELEVPAPQAGHFRMGTPAVWLDPAAPGVAEHVSAIFAELLAGYPELDGLHLDYVRYPYALPVSPGTRFGVGLSFGHGAPTRARFRSETGRDAPFQGSLRNGDRFDDWRREKLTELVELVRLRANASRPGVALSAAVLPWTDRAYLASFQDWRGWLDEDVLDFAVPMLYTRDDRLLGYKLDAFSGLPRAERIWVGLGAWLFARSPERATAQIAQVASHPPLGLALFSWDSIAEEPDLRAALAEASVGRRAQAPASAGGSPGR